MRANDIISIHEQFVNMIRKDENVFKLVYLEFLFEDVHSIRVRVHLLLILLDVYACAISSKRISI